MTDAVNVSDYKNSPSFFLNGKEEKGVPKICTSQDKAI